MAAKIAEPGDALAAQIGFQFVMPIRDCAIQRKRHAGIVACLHGEQEG